MHILNHSTVTYQDNNNDVIPNKLIDNKENEIKKIANNVIHSEKPSKIDIKNIILAASVYLNESLILEDSNGRFLFCASPKKGFLNESDIQLLTNTNNNIKSIKTDDISYTPKVDDSYINKNIDFYKALLIASKQCSYDIISDEDVIRFRFSLADSIHKNINILNKYWIEEQIIDNQHTIIDIYTENTPPQKNITNETKQEQQFFLHKNNIEHTIINIPQENNIEHTIINIPQENNIESTIALKNSKEWQTDLNRYIKNLRVVLTRNLISVGLPTAAREYVRRSALPVLFENIPQAMRISSGGIAASIPIALQLIGIARDYSSGTQTMQTLSARLANIALTASTGAALVATGGLSAAANALIAAVFVYVPLRDLSQYFLQLQDNSDANIQFNSTALSSMAYIGNQVIVDQSMEAFTKVLEPLMGALAANILARALINISGETVDDFTNRGIHAYCSDNPKLELNLGFRPKNQITKKTATDQILNTLAGRVSLFSAAFSGAYAVPVQGLLNSIVVGSVLGAGYTPFVYGHAQKTPDNVSDDNDIIMTNFRSLQEDI